MQRTLEEVVANIPAHQKEGRTWSPVDHAELYEWLRRKLQLEKDLTESCLNQQPSKKHENTE